MVNSPALSCSLFNLGRSLNYQTDIMDCIFTWKYIKVYEGNHRVEITEVNWKVEISIQNWSNPPGEKCNRDGNESFIHHLCKNYNINEAWVSEGGPRAIHLPNHILQQSTGCKIVGIRFCILTHLLSISVLIEKNKRAQGRGTNWQSSYLTVVRFPS